MSAQHTILLVDDDMSIADILNRAASRVWPQATIIHATSFAEASAYLSDLSGLGPRLVLLDINLQTGPSGLDFLSLLREHPQGRLLPVIVLSASQQEQDTLKAYELGASAYMQKPFSYNEWKAFVEQLRSYWFETVTIPKLWFKKDSESEPQ